MSTSERILELLQKIRPEFDFTTSTNFIEDGYLDSFDIVAVVSELETIFNIIIDGLEIIPENFRTVDTISDLVERNGGTV